MNQEALHNFHPMRLEWDREKWLDKTPRLIISPHPDGQFLITLEATSQGSISQMVDWDEVLEMVAGYLKYQPTRRKGAEGDLF